eukprot:s1036_g5.t1
MLEARRVLFQEHCEAYAAMKLPQGSIQRAPKSVAMGGVESREKSARSYIRATVYDVDTSTEIYFLNGMLRPLGTGIFHCGVQILSDEWSFRGGRHGGTGVFRCPPGLCGNLRPRETCRVYVGRHETTHPDLGFKLRVSNCKAYPNLANMFSTVAVNIITAAIITNNTTAVVTTIFTFAPARRHGGDDHGNLWASINHTNYTVAIVQNSGSYSSCNITASLTAAPRFTLNRQQQQLRQRIIIIIIVIIIIITVIIIIITIMIIIIMMVIMNMMTIIIIFVPIAISSYLWFLPFITFSCIIIVISRSNSNIVTVEAILERLKLQWPCREYDVFRRNCSHFCDEFCTQLGVGPLPAWVTNMAGAAAQLADVSWKVRSATSNLADTISSLFEANPENDSTSLPVPVYVERMERPRSSFQPQPGRGGVSGMDGMRQVDPNSFNRPPPASSARRQRPLHPTLLTSRSEPVITREAVTTDMCWPLPLHAEAEEEDGLDPTKDPGRDKLESACTTGGYHCVLGDRLKARGTYREYVVYDHFQVYPQFIVWYSRT